MTVLSWKLSTEPTPRPEYWLLFVDGFSCTALINQAPYKGSGDYSVDLTQLDAGSPVPIDGSSHNYSVALVGGGAIGPQSAAVPITLPAPVAATKGGGTVDAQQPPDAWPAADALVST